MTDADQIPTFKDRNQGAYSPDGGGCLAQVLEQVDFLVIQPEAGIHLALPAVDVF